MAQPLLRERHGRWLLFVVLASQFALLSSQVKAPEDDRSRLESVLLRLVAPLSRASSGTKGVLAQSRERVRFRGALLTENQQLHRDVERLERELMRFRGLEQDLGRLSSAVEYQRLSTEPLLVADIVYRDSTSWTQTLVAHTAAFEAEANQPVTSPKGLVGRVVAHSGPYVRIQLLTDGAANIGAMVDRTRRQGILRGLGRRALQLDLVPLQEDVRVGDLIVTAGIDGVYPRGLTIGRISAIRPGSELFHDIRVEPSVDFSELDQVYLLSRLPESKFLGTEVEE